MRLRESFWALFGGTSDDSRLDVLEHIRSAMQESLDTHCGDTQTPLDIKINNARNVEELWYLRPELMLAICAHRNETTARTALMQITVLFEGHHPGASPSRFASL